MLRQVVGDLVPSRFGTHEDMHRRADIRLVQERAHRNVDVFSGPDDGVKQRSAISTVNVMSGLLVAIYQQAIAPPIQTEGGAMDTRQGLKGRTRCEPAPRAMAIERIFELIAHQVLDRPAKTLTS